jgi:hypothetical protein
MCVQHAGTGALMFGVGQGCGGPNAPSRLRLRCARHALRLRGERVLPVPRVARADEGGERAHALVVLARRSAPRAPVLLLHQPPDLAPRRRRGVVLVHPRKVLQRSEAHPGVIKRSDGRGVGRGWATESRRRRVRAPGFCRGGGLLRRQAHEDVLVYREEASRGGAKAGEGGGAEVGEEAELVVRRAAGAAAARVVWCS